MARVTLKGNTINTSGKLPEVGSSAPDFTLVRNDLSEASLQDFTGNTLILNIFPSIDTGTCATSTRTFNKLAGKLKQTAVLCISRDLPFAQARFCGAEGLDNVIMLSDFQTGAFGKSYGLDILDGPLKGLHSRAIVVINKKGNIIYTEQVPEIVDEPDYDSALKAII